jgi:hypothetical protein
VTAATASSADIDGRGEATDISPSIIAAVEEQPGGWSGYISYTLQGTAYGLGTGNFKPGRFWRDGDGKNFKTVDHNAANAISAPRHLPQ